MDEKMKVAIVKALIGAIVPQLFSELIKFVKKKHEDVPLEDLAGKIDWDAEYEKLLEEYEKETRPPWWKRVRK